MVNNLYQRWRYKNLYFSPVLCVSNCHLFILPTIPVSFYFSPLEETGMFSLHCCWCISLEIKSVELSKTELVKNNSRFIEWWVGSSVFVLSSGTCEIFNPYHRFSDIISGTAQMKSQILKMRNLGDLVTHRKATDGFVKESEVVFNSKAHILSRLN